MGLEDGHGLAHLGDLARQLGGWGRLVSAPAHVFRSLPAPPPDPVAGPTEAIRRALDPGGVMNPGRLHEGVL
ncbi:MAG: hypothetical protein HY815_00815 [Candidatus Riflebacteria bacterium]|nr:hypothetical protein [Candidatus Riflebacteria bacterium]